jgi:GMP synthase-like glutamine amidotransferase
VQRRGRQWGEVIVKIHCSLHVAHEGPGLIADWAAARGHTLAEVHVYQGERLPELAEVEWLVVMGGPMNVYEEDRYAWLVPETELIRGALLAGKLVLGICLGAQLMAKALGARVRPNGHQEIGWFPVVLTPEALRTRLFNGFPARVPAFHWHGDTFEIPAKALPLGSSEGCANQGFILTDEHGVGLQFHWEVRPDDVEAWLHGGDAAQPGPHVQPAATMRASEAFAHSRELLETLLDRMAAGTAPALRQAAARG